MHAPECQANARLIAAAPELFDELRNGVEWLDALLDGRGIPDDVEEVIRTVIERHRAALTKVSP